MLALLNAMPNNYTNWDYYNRIRYHFWFQERYPYLNESVSPYNPKFKYPPAPDAVEAYLVQVDSPFVLLKVLEHDAKTLREQLKQKEDAKAVVTGLLTYSFMRYTVKFHKKGSRYSNSYATRPEDQIEVSHRAYSLECSTFLAENDRNILLEAEKKFLPNCKAQFISIESPDGRKFIVRNQYLKDGWGLAEKEVMKYHKDATVLK